MDNKQERLWLQPILGSVVIFASLVTVGLVLTGWAKVDSALAGTLAGYMVRDAQTVISYYFGSSAGSRAKDALLAAKADAAP